MGGLVDGRVAYAAVGMCAGFHARRTSLRDPAVRLDCILLGGAELQDEGGDYGVGVRERVGG